MEWGGHASHLKVVSTQSVFILLIMTPELFPLLLPRRRDIASPCEDEPLQKRCRGGAPAHRFLRFCLTFLTSRPTPPTPSLRPSPPSHPRR